MAYIVKMWLSCGSTSANGVAAAFAERWTTQLKEEWSAISCSSTNPGDLADELNARVQADCLQQIADDVAGGDTSKIDSIEAFSSSGWITGSGGLHSGSSISIYAMPPTGGGTPWRFEVGQTLVDVFINAQFQGTSS